MTNLEITKAYVGSDQISKLYLGGEAIWPSTPPEPVYSAMPLTFKIISGGTIVWKAENSANTKTIQYSKDDGLTWTPITSTTMGTSIYVNADDKVQFRGDNAAYDAGGLQASNSFSGSTAKFEAEGNIMSLIDSTNFATATTLVSSYTFNKLFRNCTGLTSAENLILPATTLAESCYRHMFWNCTSLTTAPELPATTLASNCYYTMFGGCTSLTSAPELPATTLASTCYQGMFSGCTSLTSAPALPATTLTSSCYVSMFRGCRNLRTAPEILATDYGTTKNSCRYMFMDCTNLYYIKCMFNQAPPDGGTSPTRDWVSGVSFSGTFVKAAGVIWKTGTNGIPSGWSVEDA